MAMLARPHFQPSGVRRVEAWERSPSRLRDFTANDAGLTRDFLDVVATSVPGGLPALESIDLCFNSIDRVGALLRLALPSLRVLKRGSQSIQFATHQSLAPERNLAGPEGTLPHLMGVHAYVTQWRGEPLFSLDLRVHNAHSGNNPNDPMDDALGKIYFDELDLKLPPGWVVFNASRARVPSMFETAECRCQAPETLVSWSLIPGSMRLTAICRSDRKLCRTCIPSSPPERSKVSHRTSR